MTSSNSANELVISINGKEYRPLKKILSKGEILKLAGLENNYQLLIYMLAEDGKKITIESEEGIELHSGMRFIISGT